MEGPSLVIACEEFAKFNGQKVKSAKGTAKIPFQEIKGHQFKYARSWGKHFLLVFEKLDLRIHFLMFGSYRIDSERENRIPKMTLKFENGTINFYSCAIKVLEEGLDELYDWSADTMSKAWSSPKALRKVKAKPEEMVCDVLMDQDIFAGVGNIIKNEVLFRLQMHPETRIRDLSAPQLTALIRETRKYCLQFYKWKKVGELKRNWKIFRKRVCPQTDTPVTKRPTGKLARISHYCEVCQIL